MPSYCYIVRPGDDNDELRWSLRSLVNAPDVTDVWIIGSCPGWVTGVRTLLLPSKPSKWPNIHQSLEALAACEQISEPFVMMNDDMVFTRPVDELVPIHLGTVTEHIETRRRTQGHMEANNSHVRGMVAARQELRRRGMPDEQILCYESHTPMIFRRAWLADMLATAKLMPFLPCSLYSAGGGPVGVRGQQAKVHETSRLALRNNLEHGQPYLSTDDRSFRDGAVGKYVRELFPDPCRFEKG